MSLNTVIILNKINKYLFLKKRNKYPDIVFLPNDIWTYTTKLTQLLDNTCLILETKVSF